MVAPILSLTPDQFFQFCIQYSSLTLVYYDYFLTLEREIKYVWQRKFHILTVMYFFCRYAAVSNIIFVLGLEAWVRGLSCDAAYTVAACLSVLGRLGIVTILGVRTCAVFRYNRALVTVFAVMGAFVIGLAIAHVPNVSCTGHKIKRNRIATDLLCVFTVVYEVLATAVLAWGCQRSMHAVGPVTEQRKGLIFLMLKEGLLYTGFVTTFTTTAMILNYAAELGSFWQRLLNALTIPISGIMAARFLLHVREWQEHDDFLLLSTTNAANTMPNTFGRICDPEMGDTRSETSSTTTHAQAESRVGSIITGNLGTGTGTGKVSGPSSTRGGTSKKKTQESPRPKRRRRRKEPPPDWTGPPMMNWDMLRDDYHDPTLLSTCPGGGVGGGGSGGGGGEILAGAGRRGSDGSTASSSSSTRSDGDSRISGSSSSSSSGSSVTLAGSGRRGSDGSTSSSVHSDGDSRISGGSSSSSSSSSSSLSSGSSITLTGGEDEFDNGELSGAEDDHHVRQSPRHTNDSSGVDGGGRGWSSRAARARQSDSDSMV